MDGYLLKRSAMGQHKIPDARWINRDLDIRRVASELCVRGAENRFHCWHPEKHSNGDADASVGYWRTANRLRCFVCDRPAIAVIDLVMDILGVDFQKAISWIAQRFEVPQISARKPLERSEHRRIDSVTDPITYLVRSHIFSRLSMPARLLAPVLIAFSEHEGNCESPRKITISYKALMRYSGLKSPNAVSRGIEELRLIGWVRGGSKPRGVARTTGAYVVTPFATPVVELGHMLAKEEQLVIGQEREQAKRRRQDRERVFRSRQRNRNAA